MTYRNIKDFKSNTILNDGDTVYLGPFEYYVTNPFLNNLNGRNDEIFDFLKIDKKKFCSLHYGYLATSGDWPCYKDRDFNAATRVVKALFQKLNSNIQIY